MIKDILTSWQKNRGYIKDFNSVMELSTCMNREYYINDITPEIADSADAYIRFWNRVDDENQTPIELREPIKLYIDSSGGDLVAAYAIIDSISLSRTPIITINTAQAYSSGFLIFIAGHQRIAYPQSSFLFHEGKIAVGYEDAHKFANMAEFYNIQLDYMKNIVLKYTKISVDEYEKLKKDDTWFTAQEALEKGICDEIADRFI